MYEKINVHLNTLKKTALPVIFLTFNSGFAQTVAVDGIKNFRAVLEIEKNGYCAVYEEEGQKGKIRNYTLKFLDFDYSETNAAKVELSKNATVCSSVSNDSHLAIAFSDMKLERVSVKSFDINGNPAGSLELSESKMPAATIYKSSEGFVIVNQIYKGSFSTKADFEIISTDNKLNVQWKKLLNDENIREIVDVEATENGVIVVYSAGKGMGKEKYSQHLMRISTEGKVLFDEVFANNYFYYPNKIIVDGDQTLVFGSFPEEGKSKPAGVFGIIFDQSGSVLYKKEVNYESEISPLIKDIQSEEEINMKETPQFIVNDVIKTENGYIVVTETIQLRPAVGVGVEVSTGGSGGSLSTNTAFHMGDFLVLKLEKDLQLQNIQIVTKKKNRVVFEGIIANVNLYYQVLKNNNVSNYQFSLNNEDGHPTMVYTIRESFRSNISVGVVDLSDTKKVLKSKETESELQKMKDVSGFGILKNSGEKISIYVYRKAQLTLYDLKY